MQLSLAIVAYKAGDVTSRRWAEQCARQLQDRGCRILMGPSGARDNPYPVFLESAGQPIDLAVVLGGDGSSLAAARHLAPYKVPILAINAGGHLGFLTESPEECGDTEAIWDRLQADHFAIQRRMMLQAQVFDSDDRSTPPSSETFLCLNEMCVKPGSVDRMPSAILEMEIDREVVDQYQGDGLIVATPTGTTSYTVAASGPIVSPGLDAITITPICPLSLSSRPIVLPPGVVVTIWPLANPDLTTKLWTDGVLGTSIWPGQRIDIRMAQHQAQFIILRQNYSYYQTLREKLQWTGARIHWHNSHRNGYASPPGGKTE